MDTVPYVLLTYLQPIQFSLQLGSVSQQNKADSAKQTLRQREVGHAP